MEFEWGQLLAISIFALLAGLVDAIAGGGGLIQFPAFLILFPQIPVPVLMGTNKIASFSGTLVAVIKYVRSVKIPWVAVWPAMITALIFAFVGAWFISYLSKEIVKPIVLILLIGVFIYTKLNKHIGATTPSKLSNKLLKIRALISGAILGFYDGFFGPGTGSFLLFIYAVWLGFDLLRAAVSAKLVNLATNIAALAYFICSGQYLLKVAIPVALMNMAGSLIGANLVIKRGVFLIRQFFSIVIFLLIVKLAYDIVKHYINNII
ncbi:MAG: TSUP family transporter [Flavobacteriales bacterium]|nr:TSUP family transporter [Flavobacteriales bacterium]